MARKLQPAANSLYGMPQPLSTAGIGVLVFKRAPTASDKGFPIGQLWFDSVGTTLYELTSVAGGSAVWQTAIAAVGPVATIEGDAGGAIAPVANNITLAGDGVNISTSGAAGTITFTVSLTPTFTTVTTDALDITTGGAGDTAGEATLVGGTQTVLTTSVTANSLIFVTVKALGTVADPQPMMIENIVAGTSFDITSADATDTSTVSWMIVEPV